MSDGESKNMEDDMLTKIVRRMFREKTFQHIVLKLQSEKVPSIRADFYETVKATYVWGLSVITGFLINYIIVNN